MVQRTVSAGLAKAFMQFASARGVNLQALSAQSGIDPSALEDHDHRVPFENYMALVRGAKDMAGDSALPMHFAEEVDVSEFSVVGLLTHASMTMMEAFEQLNRYGQLVVEVDIGATGRFALESRNGGVWIADKRADADSFWELTESTFTRMTVGPRRFLPRPHILEVHVTHPAPMHVAEYDRIFRCPVVFESDWNAMLMDMSLAYHKVQLQPRYVFGVLSAHADQLLKDLENSRTTRGRVESLLMPILHTGKFSVERIAEKMGISRQTLFRKLRAEGATFEKVLDELRHKLAVHYLSGKKVSVNETAYLVGFSDAASFSRAFKRWTGVSPRESLQRQQ